MWQGGGGERVLHWLPQWWLILEKLKIRKSEGGVFSWWRKKMWCIMGRGIGGGNKRNEEEHLCWIFFFLSCSAVKAEAKWGREYGGGIEKGLKSESVRMISKGVMGLCLFELVKIDILFLFLFFFSPTLQKVYHCFNARTSLMFFFSFLYSPHLSLVLSLKYTDY